MDRRSVLGRFGAALTAIIHNGRQYLIVGGSVLGVILLAVGFLVWPGHLLRNGSAQSPPGSPTAPVSAGPSPTPGHRVLFGPGQPVPPAAAAVATTLVSGTPTQQRAALVKPLAASLPADAVPYPPGCTITMDANSWQQTGTSAHATAVVTNPGTSPQHIEIGFFQDHGSWFVTYTGPLA